MWYVVCGMWYIGLDAGDASGYKVGSGIVTRAPNNITAQLL